MLNLSIQLHGVKVTTLKQINDSRGAVLHMIRNDSEEFTTFGECYFSEIFPNSIKAWKKHTIQTQNIVVPIGRVKLVLFDDREGSPTEGKLMQMELCRPDSYLRVTIPPQIWYGFKCTGETPALITNCVDIPHELNESIIIDYLETSLPYNWVSDNVR
uniref:hypothetical protein n=1 Tax=Algoriphagus sp. TaxID=1872435 RepID=UPI0040481750